jgi:hypothetical protein
MSVASCEGLRVAKTLSARFHRATLVRDEPFLPLFDALPENPQTSQLFMKILSSPELADAVSPQ